MDYGAVGGTTLPLGDTFLYPYAGGTSLLPSGGVENIFAQPIWVIPPSPGGASTAKMVCSCQPRQNRLDFNLWYFRRVSARQPTKRLG